MAGNKELMNQIKYLFIDVDSKLMKKSFECKAAGEVVEYLNAAKRTVDIPLQLMVMGEFSTGKSTFINAIVGKKVAAINARPTTAIITKLAYGEKELFTIYYKDGRTQEVAPELFQSYTDENKKNDINRAEIDYVEYRIPIDILKDINIIDSPGLNTTKNEHISATKRFIHKADAIAWMLSVEEPLKASEIKEIGKLPDRLKPIIILNKIDTVDEEEDNLDDIVDSVKAKLAGKSIAVLPISAELALDGKLAGHADELRESNIDSFFACVQQEILPRKDVYRASRFVDMLSVVAINLMDLKDEAENQNITYEQRMTTQKEFLAISNQLEPIIECVNDYLISDENNVTAEKYLFLACRTLLYTSEMTEDVLKKITDYLEKSANLGNFTAAFMAGAFYGGCRDYEKSRYWLINLKKEDLYEIDDTEADIKEDLASIQFYLAETYLQEYEAIGKGDIDKAVELFNLSVDGGNKDAYNQLGYMYQNGIGVAQDFSKAVACYKECAESGNPIGEYNYGFMFYNGYGVKKDLKTAEKWIRKSAEHGYPTAQVSMGSMYSTGELGAVDAGTAISWLEKAAQQKDPGAFMTLGNIYASGLMGVTVDYAKAVAYLEQIDNCDMEACFFLGLIYYEGGHGVEQDSFKAIKYLCRGAEAGNDKCQQSLGYIYIDGPGEFLDIAKSKYWLEKSAEQGNELARRQLDEVRQIEKNSNMKATAASGSGCLMPIIVTFAAVVLLALVTC